MRIRLFDGFRVSVGERSIGEERWRLKKAATLVKLLALEGAHRIHRERLMDLLWPELDAKAAANNLHRTLHFARRTLKSDPTTSAHLHLRLQGDLLALCPETPLWVDIESFEMAARAARNARDPAAYRAAIELYSGEFLPQDRYEEWAQERREELRLTHQRLLIEVATLYEEREGLGDRWRIDSVLEGLAGTACARGELERAGRVCLVRPRPCAKPSALPCHSANAPSATATWPPPGWTMRRGQRGERCL